MTDPEHRVPPRQKVVQTFPVMTSQGIPRIDVQQWRLSVIGRVKEPLSLTYDQVRQMPSVDRVCDFHCVTGWSRLGDRWTGIWARDLIVRAKPLPRASFVFVHSCDGYTTNLDLEIVLSDGMLVWAVNGQELTVEHGYPLRLLVPSRYGWKSAKWVHTLELMEEDRPGYWEERGYHMKGDVWAEERYGVLPPTPFKGRR